MYKARNELTQQIVAERPTIKSLRHACKNMSESIRNNLVVVHPDGLIEPLTYPTNAELAGVA